LVYIGAPPQQFTIPVTLGADVEFTVNRVDTSNNPVSWSAAVFMAIDIDRANPTTVNATVTGNQAVLLLHSSVCDEVKNTTRWRLYMQTGTAPDTLTLPIAVGNFERDDGGSS
jgi:hypothetical protein